MDHTVRAIDIWNAVFIKTWNPRLHPNTGTLPCPSLVSLADSGLDSLIYAAPFILIWPFSSSPWSLEFVYRDLSYLIISLKGFLSLSSSLEFSFKILDSVLRSIMCRLQNVSCSSCSFQKFFFKENLSVWHCERIGCERQTELDLKINGWFKSLAEKIIWTFFLIYDLL